MYTINKVKGLLISGCHKRYNIYISYSSQGTVLYTISTLLRSGRELVEFLEKFWVHFLLLFFCHNKSKAINTVLASLSFFFKWGALSIIYLHAFQYSSELKKRQKKQNSPEGYMAAACADEYGSIPLLVIPGKSM